MVDRTSTSFPPAALPVESSRRASIWFVLLVTTIICSVSLAVKSSSFAQSPAITRTTGSDRYHTAVEIARAVGEGSLARLDHLIVVSGEAFTDAMVASGLAGFLDTHRQAGRTAILLTQTERLPDVTAEAIRSSGVPASRVFVVGGEAVVSDQVRRMIAQATGWDGSGPAPVTRIAGANRHETAEAIVEYVIETADEELRNTYRTAMVVNSERLPDLLSASAFAYRSGHLLLLASESRAPDSTIRALENIRARRILLIGGTSVLPEAIETRISASMGSFTPQDLSPLDSTGVYRIAGENRYETAALIAERFVADHGPPVQAIIASGIDFSDSLTAGPLAGRNRPVLLTAPDRLPFVTKNWLSRFGPGTGELVVIGDSDAVPVGVVEEVRGEVNLTPSPSGPPLVIPSPTTTEPPPTTTTEPPPTTTEPSPTTTEPPPTTTTEPPPTTTEPPPQTFGATRGGGSGDDLGNGVAHLLDGSVLVTGHFSGVATFGGSSVTSTGLTDVFVAKISPSGTWEWVARAGSSSGNDAGQAVTVLADGSAVVTGFFTGVATFGGSSVTSRGSTDVFVAKIDTSGAWEWVVGGGSASDDRGLSVTATPDGSVIVTGYFRVSGLFGTNTVSGSGAEEVFVAKVSAAGSWSWARAAGGSGSDYGFSVSSMSDGSSYVTGYFSGSATFGGATLGSAGGADAFVAKVSATGSWLWARRVGGTQTELGWSISVSTDGSAIVSGQFGGSVSFGSTSLTSLGGDDVFVARINSSGTWLWASRAGGSAGPDRGHQVAGLSDGSAIVTGPFWGTATFGTTSMTSSGGFDVFVAKISSTGAWEWAKRAGGKSTDVAFGLSTTNLGSAVIVGEFSGEATLGNSTMTSAGGRDVFVAGVDSSGNVR